MNSKKEIIKTLIIFVLVLLFAFAVSATLEKVFAQSDLPEGVEVFHIEDMTFVRDKELGKLVYWCTYSCGECVEEEIVIYPLPKITPTDTPSDIPADIPPTDPTPTTQPTSTPVPEPTEKPKCNKGEGNLGEGCDPGNHPELGNDDED